MSDQPKTNQGSRPWLIATLVSGALLVAAIVTSLSAALGRIGKTRELLDQPGTQPEDLARLAEESAQLTKLSLYAGLPVALVYITSLIIYRRSRKPR